MYFLSEHYHKNKIFDIYVYYNINKVKNYVKILNYFF